MPGRDGTGPCGQGARTGRGLGFCRTTTESAAEPMNTFPGMGFGRRFGPGAGRGFGRRQRMTARERRLLNQENLNMADRSDRAETVTAGDLHRLTDVLTALQQDVRMLHDRLDEMQERAAEDHSPADQQTGKNEPHPTDTE